MPSPFISARAGDGLVLKKFGNSRFKSFVFTTPSLLISAARQTGCVGDGVGVLVGAGVGLGVGVGVGLGEGLGVGDGVAVELGVGVMAG